MEILDLHLQFSTVTTIDENNFFVEGLILRSGRSYTWQLDFSKN